MVLGLEEVARNHAGGLKNLSSVSVVDLQNGCSSLGLDAHALEAELTRVLALIDALRIVVEQQETVGVRVHHLGDQLEPLGLKVVALIDQHSLVLARGNLIAIDSA